MKRSVFAIFVLVFTLTACFKGGNMPKENLPTTKESYSRDDKHNIVTDNTTGLMW